MTDILLSGQQIYDQKFYLPSVLKGNVIDDFKPQVPVASIPGVWRKCRVGPIGSSGANSINTYQVQARNTLIGDMFLEVSLAATGGGNYCTFPCISLPTNVRISHGSNELHNYLYRPTMNKLFGDLPNELKTRYQQIGGGSGSGSAVIGYAPLPTFWTSFRHSANDFPTPLPLGASSTNLQIEVTLDSIANILASGGSGGSLTSATLVYWEFIPDGKEANNVFENVKTPKAWQRFGYDYQTVSATTVATGTSSPTTIDLSGLQGSIKELDYYGVTSTNNDTNHSYFTQQALVYADLQVDSISIYSSVQGTSNELILDQLIFNSAKVGSDSTYGECYQLNFGRRHDSHAWDGSLNSSIFKKLSLLVEQSSGGNVYANVVATMTRYYVFENGLFSRIK